MEGAWAARAARAVHRAEEEETVAAARVVEERVVGATVVVATAEEGRGAVATVATVAVGGMMVVPWDSLPHLCPPADCMSTGTLR